MITLPSKIERDIQGNQTSLIPLIVIAPESNNPIYISSVKDLFDVNTFYEDVGLKVSSIKESVDLQKGIFKINNLALSLSNYVINGQRFSDFVAERGLLNSTIDVYYKSQTCTTLDDCIKIYSGNIRRFTHDDKVCKIQLEDKTEDKLSKEVPIASTGYRSSVYSKDYINKPIPILYGSVDRAPAIPFFSQNQLHHESKILIICDDTLGDNPRVKIGNYFADDGTNFLFSDGTVNPLYIYKDDYFQVLENYNLDVITGDTTDWEWMEYDQYTRRDGYLEVSKRYEGLTAKNPPADNELQCVKIRFPNDFITLPNPLFGESQWFDENNFGVSYDQSMIKAPELAYDNPFNGNLTSSDFTINPENYKESFSQIPDNTISILADSENIFIKYNFEATRPILGIPNRPESESNIRSQFEIMSWLIRYADGNNQDIDNPNLSFIKLPSGQSIQRRMNKTLFKEWAESLFSGVWDDGFDIISYYDDNNIDIPDMTYHENYWNQGYDNDYKRVNTSVSFNAEFCTSWAEAQGYTDLSSFANTFSNQQGDLWSSSDPENENSFYHLHSVDNNKWGKPEGVDVQYPNLYIRAKIISEYPSPPIPIYYLVNGQQETGYADSRRNLDLGYDYATASLKNGDIADYNADFVGKYFNLIDLEDGEGGLWSVDEIPTYTPFRLASKARAGNNDDAAKVYYDAYWNGVSAGIGSEFRSGVAWGLDTYYFGGYGAGHYGEDTGTTYDVREKFILPNQYGDYASGGGDEAFGWCIWVRQNISSSIIGTGNLASEEENLNTSGLRIEKNTLIPTVCYSKTDGLHDFDNFMIAGTNLGNGVLQDPDGEVIRLSNTGTSASRRYAGIFPFKDQEISNDIKTDTYFSGKIKLNFDVSAEGTANTNNTFLKVVLGAVDVNANNTNTGVDIDWDVFDQGLDATGGTLINTQLSTCFNHPETFYNTFDQNPEITNGNDGILNHFNGNLTPIIDTFFEVNNYNSLAMMFRLDGQSESGGVALNAVFDLEVHSVSLLHYIVFEAALDSPLYINCEGRVNLPEDTNEEGNFKYTNQPITENNQNNYSLIRNPADIIYHFLEKELDLIDFVDTDRINVARNNSIISSMAFSLSNVMKSKHLIEKICQNSNLFPSFKGTSLFSLSTIKSIYTSSDVTINNKDVIKYSFTRTPVEKINTIVNVKYRKDYATNQYMEETGYVDSYDMFGNKDLGYENGYSYDYLRLDREDKVLEFESDFIRSKGEARALRDFLLLYSCNQHNIFKLSLPLKYFHLEAGDVISFDSLLGGVKVYGEDYTEPATRNGQTIYPFFIINSIDKKPNQINLEATQLHKLEREFTPELGSITRTLAEGQSPNYTIEDIEELDDFIVGAKKYYTEEQKRVSDINLDNYIDEHDLIALQGLMNLNIFNSDINADGIVNVIDIVELVNQILGSEEQTEELLNQFDINQDGSIDIIDVVTLTEEVLGGS